jgi:hypothetical protein
MMYKEVSPDDQDVSCSLSYSQIMDGCVSVIRGSICCIAVYLPIIGAVQSLNIQSMSHACHSDDVLQQEL